MRGSAISGTPAAVSCSTSRFVAGETYGEGVAGDPAAEFLDGLTPEVRDIAERLILIVRSQADFDVAIKWRQLTFAVDGDFDEAVVRELLPQFRAMRRGLAGPSRRRS